MKRQPLRRFLADSRQVLKLVDQSGEWFREIRHKSDQRSAIGVQRRQRLAERRSLNADRLLEHARRQAQAAQ